MALLTETEIYMDLLLVGAGGFLGANARYILSSYAARRLGTAFPYGTFFINITGSFILALFSALASRSILAGVEYRWLVAVGFCGGYTTFSTYTFETLTMLRERNLRAALLFYLIGSFIAGLLSALVGFWLGNVF